MSLCLMPQFVKTPSGKMQRQDPLDAGPAYRNVVGLPGGINSPYFKILQVGACFPSPLGMMGAARVASCWAGTLQVLAAEPRRVGTPCEVRTPDTLLIM